MSRKITDARPVKIDTDNIRSVALVSSIELLTIERQTKNACDKLIQKDDDDLAEIAFDLTNVMQSAAKLRRVMDKITADFAESNTKGVM